MSEPHPLCALLAPERDRSAVVAFRRGEMHTLRDLESQVRRWYAAFAVAPGHRYVVHSLDALEFVAALFGAWHAGKCALVPSDLQVASIGQSGVVVDGYADVIGSAAAAVPWEGDLPILDPEAPLLEVFTSGSTGSPVSIAKCIRQLEQEVLGLTAALDFGAAGGRVLGTVSHQHMYGLIFRVLLPLATARPFEAMRLPQVQDLSQVHAGGCILVSSPAQLTRLPAVGHLRGRVGMLLSAGGPLDDEASQACMAVFGVVPVEIYGSSETGAVAWRRRVPAEAMGWQPVPGVLFRNDDGVLLIQGRQLPTQDWFRSADRITQTATGFELQGRTDRVVKLEEKRVSLDAVERLLLASGLLQKARALVLDRPRPMLAVIAMPSSAGWALMEAAKRGLVVRLLDHLRQTAEIEVLPKSWRFVDPWPATVDGKTPESLLRERFDRRNPEFRVIEQDAAGCTAAIWVSPTAPFFAGHFPQQPVLPGVVQVDWMVWLSRELLGVQAGFAGLEAAKFRRVILPGSWLTVTLRDDPASGRTTYRITHGDAVCASGRIRWSGER